MSRKFKRLFKFRKGHVSKILPYLKAGFDLQALLSTGTGLIEGERVEVGDTIYQIREKGRLEKIGDNYQPDKKEKEVVFTTREFIHIPKKIRKGKSLEEIRLLRPAPITNIQVEEPESEKTVSLDTEKIATESSKGEI